jgi:hypothetical protein
MIDMRLRADRRARILRSAGFVVCFGLLAAGLAADRGDVRRPPRETPILGRDGAGPYPPPGVDSVGKIFGLRSLLEATVIPGVPPYLWHHGSAPAAVGMVFGYYDGHGFPDLLPGDAVVQTEAVNSALVSAEHYADYSLPLDAPPTLLPDRSELPRRSATPPTAWRITFLPLGAYTETTTASRAAPTSGTASGTISRPSAPMPAFRFLTASDPSPGRPSGARS